MPIQMGIRDSDHDFPSADASGGTWGLRGYEFQAQSLIHYLLLRLLAHSTLRMHVERIEDALMEYDGDIRELVQCKKAEERGSDVVRPGYGGEVVALGKFQPKDLQQWLAHAHNGLTLAQRLEAPGTFFTALLLSEISNRLVPYQGWRRGRTAADLWLRPDFGVCFPVDSQHKTDPDASAAAPATGTVRRKVRLMLMPGWAELALASERLLRNQYGVPVSRSNEALGSLLRFYSECALAKDSDRKIITGADVRRILDSFRGEGSGWASARRWLRHEESGPTPWLAEQVFNWADFEAGRYLHWPQFDDAWQALQKDRFVLIHGHAGSGKTTLARYLAYRFLKEHPSIDGYVLALGADLELTEEKKEIESRVGMPTLFIIDDAHLAPDAAKAIARVYHDRSLAGGVPSRLVVTSHDTYTQRMLTDPAKYDDPFTYGYAVRFSPLVSSEIATALREYTALTGVDLPLSAETIAELAEGKLGLAFIIMRAAADMRGAKSLHRLGDSRRLYDLFKDWILLKTGQSGEGFFEKELLPVFNVARFGISVDDRFGPGVALLRSTGFLGEPGKAARSGESALTYLLNKSRPKQVWTSIQRRFDHRTRDLPMIAGRLGTTPFGRETLQALTKNRLREIGDVLADIIDPLTLGEVAVVLDAIAHADRRSALDLFRLLGAPRNELSAVFLGKFLRPERMQRPSMVACFFDALFRIDRYLLRDLGKVLAANPGHEDDLLALLRSPDATLGEIASAIVAVSRCSREVARRLFEKLKKGPAFAEKVTRAERDPDAMPELVRFCSVLYRIEHEFVAEILDRYFDTDRLSSFFTDTGEHTGALIALRRLRKMRPRVVFNAVADVWKWHPHLLVRRSLQSTFATFATLIYLLSHLNRRVARSIVSATMNDARALVGKVASHTEVVPALVVIDRAIGWEPANALAEAMNPAVLQSFQAEMQRPDSVGTSLRNLARIHPELARSFAMQLDVDDLVSRIASFPLLNLACILRGVLVSLRVEGDHMRRDSILKSALMADAFRSAWQSNRSLVQATYAILLLRDAALTEDEFLFLSGHGAWGEFSTAMIELFSHEESLLYVALGLCHIVDIAPDVAEQALIACVETLPTDSFGSAPPAPTRFRVKPRPSRTGLSAYANSLVEVGAALRIASALNPDEALKLAEKLDIKRIIAAAQREVNLGRLAAFLSGLNDASRAFCHEVLAETSNEEQWDLQTKENESPRNLMLFANVLSRISATQGNRFVAFCDVHIGTEIRNFIEVEASLSDIVEWIRVLGSSRSELSAQRIDEFLPALREATEYDHSVRHLLDAANALIESGNRGDARDFANLALEHSGQLRYLRQVKDIVFVLHRAIFVEDALGIERFAERLFTAMSAVQLEMILYRQLMNRSRDAALLAAYATYLFATAAARGFDRFAPVIRDVRRELTAAIEKEARPLYRAMLAILCDAPPHVARSTAARSDWNVPWERGLAHVLARVGRPNVEMSFRDSMDLGAAGASMSAIRDVSPHASNMTFALASQIVLPHVDADVATRLTLEASDRAKDERVETIRWLLTTYPDRTHDHRTWSVWTTLRETIFRRAYLAWGSIVEAEARTALGGRAFDVYAISL